MRTKFIKLLFSIFVFSSTSNMMAQDYEEYAKEAREEVWAWDLPAFKNYHVPDEYKNESAVILATHDQILATGKSKLRVNAALAFKINKELLYTNTYRSMILINDKVSLDKYASFSFKEQAKVSGYMMSSKYKTIVGVRIIKPDGTIKEIDVDQEAVEMTEGKKDKVDHKKLAISDLQVGDIIDYFIQYEGHVDRENIPPLTFIFGGQYPILSYSVHCEIGRKLTVEYRPINGAPDFNVSTNDNKDVILDVEQKNIPKIEGYDRWVSPFREFPMIRMFILNNASKDIWKPKTARKSGLHKNVPTATIMDDAKSRYGGDLLLYGETAKKTRKMVNDFKKKNPDFTQEELASYIYDVLQYNAVNERDLDNELYFIKTLHTFLKYYKVDYKVGFVTSRYGAPANELAHRYDVSFFLLANNNSQLFTFLQPFSIAGEVDPDFEGEKAITFANPKYKGNMLQGEESTFEVPFTDENYNKSTTSIAAKFTDDPLVLEIDHSIVNKGVLKKNYQFRFYTDALWEAEMRERLGIEKSFLEEMESNRRSRKFVDDRIEREASDEKELENRFKEEISSNYDADPKEIMEYKVEHLGVTPQHPDFVARMKYKQEGLVQKAGHNYILNVGKLIGGHLDLKGDDRKRSVDIYVETARSFDFDIQIEIPEGYSVENIENLNKNINNVAGAFKSSTTQEGQLLTVKVSKVYGKSFLPVAEWENLLEMLDAAVDFKSQSVILRKI